MPVLQKHFAELKKMPIQELVASRYNKFRKMAQFFTARKPEFANSCRPFQCRSVPATDGRFARRALVAAV